jgi:ferritin
MNKVDSQLKEIIKGAIVEVQAQVAQGGTGIKEPKTLPEPVVKLLEERIGDEYNAHFFYVNASNWCQGVGYLKAAAFFTKEAANELEHSAQVQKYLVDWNVDPKIPTPKTTATFNTLIDIVGQAYDLEYALYDAYNKTSMALFQADIATFDFLQDLRIGQRESVAEYSDFLNAAKLINVNNPLDLLYYEQTYFG